MKYSPFSDVGYHHHWKLMTITSFIAVLGMIVAFMQTWFLLALLIGLGLAVLSIQWITIDPPEVTDEDVHGKSDQ